MTSPHHGRLSVVIPVHGNEPSLAHMLGTLSQEDPDLECLVVGPAENAAAQETCAEHRADYLIHSPCRGRATRSWGQSGIWCHSLVSPCRCRNRGGERPNHSRAHCPRGRGRMFFVSLSRPANGWAQILGPLHQSPRETRRGSLWGPGLVCFKLRLSCHRRIPPHAAVRRSPAGASGETTGSLPSPFHSDPGLTPPVGAGRLDQTNLGQPRLGDALCSGNGSGNTGQGLSSQTGTGRLG